MSEIKDALKTTVTVLAVLFVLNQFQPAQSLVKKALVGY